MHLVGVLRVGLQARRRGTSWSFRSSRSRPRSPRHVAHIDAGGAVRRRADADAVAARRVHAQQIAIVDQLPVAVGCGRESRTRPTRSARTSATRPRGARTARRETQAWPQRRRRLMRRGSSRADCCSEATCLRLLRRRLRRRRSGSSPHGLACGPGTMPAISGSSPADAASALPRRARASARRAAFSFCFSARARSRSRLPRAIGFRVAIGAHSIGQLRDERRERGRLRSDKEVRGLSHRKPVQDPPLPVGLELELNVHWRLLRSAAPGPDPRASRARAGPGTRRRDTIKQRHRRQRERQRIRRLDPQTACSASRASAASDTASPTARPMAVCNRPSPSICRSTRPGLRAERQPDADLARARRDQLRHDAVDADAGEHEREQRERSRAAPPTIGAPPPIATRLPPSSASRRAACWDRTPAPAA